MKFIYKFIFLVTLLYCHLSSSAQSLISGPDTLCIENNIQLSTSVTNASTYYWGFCSAYLENIPSGSSIVAGTGLNTPTSINMAKDGNIYYVFVINSGGNNEMIRYEFGTLLSNVPTAVNLGDFGGSLPKNAKGFELIQDGANWYGFVTGGNSVAESEIVRLDFGNSLANTPTVTSFGDMGGNLIQPQDLYVFKEAGNWYAITMNLLSGDIIRLDFANTITNSPSVTVITNPGSLSFPTGLWPVFDGTNWFLFVVNRVSQSITRLDFGTSLLNVPADNNLGNFGGAFNGPRDIVTIRDCDNYYGYVTNINDNSVTLLEFNGSISAVPVATNLGNFASFNQPTFLTRFLRDKDNVFCFTANRNSNSISRLDYTSCTQSSIATSTLQTPPLYTYNAPGTYNVYFVADEGLPTMQVDCKTITVLPRPYFEINSDTLICQRDTLLLVCNGPSLYSMLWEPVYNAIPPYDTTSIYIYPNEDYRYHAHLEFTQGGGCAFDTSVLIKVSRVTADAGPDRFVADGAITVLGGPMTSYGQEYSYTWTPSTYLNKSTIAEPTSTPLDVQAYYLTVKNDSSGCRDKDTVWVFTECTEINMPNVFNPVSDIPSNRSFGLLNHQIVKLEYFKIFNRWGQLIFETTDPAKKWDGRQNNIELPPDNYVWIIDGYCNNGKRIRKQGTVLLAR
ncbi:MAG: gliding motility-associated C-terminal domain-containing protein [Chitinophagaceae bacterium]